MGKKIISIILLILWLCFIFYNSNQNGVESTKESDGVIINIVSTFTNIKKDSKEMKNVVNKLSFFVRKSAHFIEYLILGGLIINVLYLFNVPRYLVISIILSIIFASIDEINQLHIADRSGEITDIILDTIGALSGVTIYYKLIAKKII